MNKDHAVAGLAGTGGTAMLATVFQHFLSLDPATATALAGLTVIALGALAHLMVRWLPAQEDTAPAATAAALPVPSAAAALHP